MLNGNCGLHHPLGNFTERGPFIGTQWRGHIRCHTGEYAPLNSVGKPYSGLPYSKEPTTDRAAKLVIDVATGQERRPTEAACRTKVYGNLMVVQLFSTNAAIFFQYRSARAQGYP